MRALPGTTRLVFGPLQSSIPQLTRISLNSSASQTSQLSTPPLRLRSHPTSDVSTIPPNTTRLTQFSFLQQKTFNLKDNTKPFARLFMSLIGAIPKLLSSPRFTSFECQGDFSVSLSLSLSPFCSWRRESHKKLLSARH